MEHTLYPPNKKQHIYGCFMYLCIFLVKQTNTSTSYSTFLYLAMQRVFGGTILYFKLQGRYTALIETQRSRKTN